MATLGNPLASVPNTSNPAILTANNDQRSNPSTVPVLIDKCANKKHLKQLHAHMLRTGLFFDPPSATKLFTACALSSTSSLDYACKVFDQIPQPNLYTWNTLIRAFASSPNPIQGLLVFIQMLHESQRFPNSYTFPFVIKAATEVSSLLVGQAIHGMVMKASFGSDLFISNSLIHFYSSSGDLDSAYLVFSKIVEKDIVSWNSMISGFVQGGFPEEALQLFQRMKMENARPNRVTMVGVLSACAKKIDLEFGRWACDYIERNGIDINLILSNAMLDMAPSLSKKEASYLDGISVSNCDAKQMYGMRSHILNLPLGSFALLKNPNKVDLMDDVSSTPINTRLWPLCLLAMETLTGLSTKVFTKNNNKTLSPSRSAQLGRSDIGFSPSPSLKRAHLDHLALCRRRDAPLLVMKSHPACEAEVLTDFETAVFGNQKISKSYCVPNSYIQLLCLPAPGKTVHVKFQLQRECTFGEQFFLVGEDPMIGLWDPSNAIPLDWSEGHTWSVELDVRIDLTMQYKFILKRSTGEIVWQPGPDRLLKTWESNSSVVIAEDWENAGAQKIMEEQVISTPDLEPVGAGNVSLQWGGVMSDVNKDLMLSGHIACAEDKSNGKYEVLSGNAYPAEGHIINADIKLESEESLGSRKEVPVPADKNNCSTPPCENPVTTEDEETLLTCEQRTVLVPGLNSSTSSL
ncbi:hypothetical protein SADUNF_Sadunf09G0034800 [Salix dunnii]|uniref:CBM20 domain-containing protein n=1 Tax=Salix dunnii TaxID=1413687 RepID=A0A835JST6_9ROSI|nr:hypothetical protein SADUNF_Sadunf09G0034800 [Salix dunnii]